MINTPPTVHTANTPMPLPLKQDWTFDAIEKIYTLPFNDLIFNAHAVHIQHFTPNTVQISTLLSIKTGRCPEDCKYCPQSAHYNTGSPVEALMSIQTVIEKAKIAKDSGATRFCMGAAWRNPPKKDFPQVLEILKAVKSLGLETCMTLGMLDQEQAQALKEAGLDFYNHNIDTSEQYYEKIIGTREFQNRLITLQHVRDQGIAVCCGGIVGMGETREDRLLFLQTLANMPTHPQSVPINQLIPVPGTPLADSPALDPIEFVRTIATARLLMPRSYVRLSAGRKNFSDETHALCFFAGANSIHYGDKLLVTPLPTTAADRALFERLGISPESPDQSIHANTHPDIPSDRTHALTQSVAV